MAFAPGTNDRSVVGKDGAYLNRNIPEECHQQMGELSKNGAKIVCGRISAARAVIAGAS